MTMHRVQALNRLHIKARFFFRTLFDFFPGYPKYFKLFRTRYPRNFIWLRAKVFPHFFVCTAIKFPPDKRQSSFVTINYYRLL